MIKLNEMIRTTNRFGQPNHIDRAVCTCNHIDRGSHDNTVVGEMI